MCLRLARALPRWAPYRAQPDRKRVLVRLSVPGSVGYLWGRCCPPALMVRALALVMRYDVRRCAQGVVVCLGSLSGRPGSGRSGAERYTNAGTHARTRILCTCTLDPPSYKLNVYWCGSVINKPVFLNTTKDRCSLNTTNPNNNEKIQ